jgi:hypothetical protein
MEPVTMIAAAVAIGASEGARETAKKVITDAYAALQSWLTSNYGSVAAEVTGLEQEPQEELRRACWPRSSPPSAPTMTRNYAAWRRPC